MYTFIIFVGVFILIGTVLILKDRDGYFGAPWLLISVFIAIGCVFSLIVSMFISIFSGVPQTNTINLAALADGGNTSGSFFLGIGTVKDRQVFSFYTNTAGVYRLEQVDAQDAVVLESTGQPHVEVHCTNRFNKNWNIVANNNKTCPFRSSTFKFYVPKGSVVNQFTLDAK